MKAAASVIRHQRNIFRSCKSVPMLRNVSGCHARSYHTYPDPSDTAKITTARSSTPKKEKVGKEYAVNDLLLMDSELVTPSEGAGDTAPIYETKTTVLPNGLTVVTQNSAGLMSSFSFTAGTGSAFEKQQMGDLEGSDSEVGVSHMLELTAFQSTGKRSHMEVSEGMEQLGGMMQCISSKENIMYCVDVLRENLDEAVEIFSDSVMNALLSDEEIEGGKELMRILRTELPSEVLSKDAVQRAAYIDYNAKSFQMMGNHHFAPTEEAIEGITAEKVRKFKREQFYGENCVVAAAGVEHEYFVELCKKYFLGSGGSGNRNSTSLQIESNPSKWEVRKQHRDEAAVQGAVRTTAAELQQYSEEVLSAKGKGFQGQPHFVGSLVTERRELKDPFVKTCVAFEVGGWHDPMLVAVCVLQQVLGGGSSFSAGGPGKGMYTRLYRNVLNQYYWVESMVSFVTIQEKCGLIGIDGASAPEHVPQMLQVMIDALYQFAVNPVSDEELTRAKNMLKSMMLMQLESRLVLCEDLARQYITYGKRVDPVELSRRIDAITADDLMEVGKRIVQGKVIGNVDGKKIRFNSHMIGPAVSVVGADVSHCPPYDNIVNFTRNYAAKLLDGGADGAQK